MPPTPFTDSKSLQLASSEGIRHTNRRAILNMIRTRQPISRAELARVSGLQRSTISLIVEELVDGNWVIEGQAGRLPRGRRPTLLHLNDDRVIIGVDIRPLKTTIALADVNGKFSSQEVMPTDADPQVAIQGVIALIHRLLHSSHGKKVEGIGISLPGRVEPGSERLVFAPNLRWVDYGIREQVQNATGFDVEMDNAANACVLAAVWFDRIVSRNVVVVTVSEGIGTGIMVNGRLCRGFGGMAGEFGHVPIDLNGPLCSCGSHGCWEVFGSNRAALRYYSESGGRSDLDFQGLLGLAEQGDRHAAEALEKMAQFLGRGMRMIVAGLDPEQIVVIGDLTRSWHRFGPVIHAEVQAQGLSGGIAPKLIPVHEDGMARLRGTVAMVLQKHFGVSEELPA